MTRLLLAAAGCMLMSVPAQAAPEPPPPVPLRENFSTLELGAAVAATAGGVFLLTAGPNVLPAPTPGMGPPSPGSLDARLSRWFYRPGKGRFLAGGPDLFGAYVFPVLPALAYGLPVFGAPSSHRLVAYMEALGWTYLLTGVIKYAVGRPRPYNELANNHPELRKRPGEDNLSFFSGHASSTFAAGVFVVEDLSRYLRRTLLVEAGPAARLMVGSVVPAAVGYGVPALVGLSRIIDQQHWPSDVVVGALVGTLVAHLTYAVHFDGDGEPRRRGKSDGAIRPVPLVLADRDRSFGGIALAGRL